MGDTRSLIILIMEFRHSFQYGAIFNKMTFSNINLLRKALLIVVLVILKVKIRKAFRCQYCQFGEFIEVKLSMSPNKKVFKFLTTLSLFSDFFCIHMKRLFAFLYYTTSFIFYGLQ